MYLLTPKPINRKRMGLQNEYERGPKICHKIVVELWYKH